MKKSILVLTLAILLAVGLMPMYAGAKVTELIWYVPGGGAWPYADSEKVYEKLNAMLEKDLGITLTIKTPGSFGEYRQKMPVIMASGEYFDLVWTAHWCNDYLSAVNNELYAPLDDLLPEYAPTIWEDTKDVLGAARVDGKIYGVWSQQIAAKTSLVEVWETHKEKYGWDMGAIKELKDIEPILADIKANEPELIPLNTRKPAPMWAKYSLGYTGIGVFEEQFLAVRIDDEQCKVFNMLEDPAYVANITLAHEWYNKGYIAKDGLTYGNDQWNNLWNSGKVGVGLHNTWQPRPPQEAAFGEYVGAYGYGDSFVEGPSITSTLNAVSAQSKHKEEAIKLLEYLWTNKEAYNLLAHGIEGIHYEKLEDGRIKSDTAGGYFPNISWVYGNTFNSYIEAPAELDFNEKVKALNESAFKPAIMGFTLDMEEIKPLVASVSAVTDQYHLSVVAGYTDPETELPKYLDALKKAGADDLIVKIQAQINAWLASK